MLPSARVKVDAQFPPKMESLFSDKRYLIYYGGRGGGKSHSIAKSLLIRAAQKPLRVLCTREVQKSIKQSVHALLSDLIKFMDMGKFYDILESEIRGKNGSSFTFAGLASTTVESVKSFESIDVVWAEEAQVISKRSWDVLIPTIRKPGSQIIVSFNPFQDSDDTYVRFVRNTPPDSEVVKINYNDNPWFTEELEKERLHCQQTDPDNYNNIWEGECLSASEMQFITTDTVREAQQRQPMYMGDDALVCGIDLARGGNDNTYIVFRRGLDAKSETTYRITGENSRDSMQVVSKIASVLEKHRPDQINVDEGGIGGPIADRLNQLGWNVTPVNFGSKAMDDKHFANRRAEMWSRMRKWLMNGGCIKSDPVLEADLTSPEFKHDNKDRLLLESKDNMKRRGLPSPDQADALALSFAIEMGPILRDDRDDIAGLRAKKTWDYNPLDNL